MRPMNQRGHSHPPPLSSHIAATLLILTTLSSVMASEQTDAESAAAPFPLPPGPVEMPFLGSTHFFFASYLVRTPLAQLLLDYRESYGPLFSFKTGPVRHVWASEQLADEMLSHPEAQWRPERKDPTVHPFYQDDFLFIVGDPTRATPIRRRQHKFLIENAGREQVATAVANAEGAIIDAIEGAPSLAPSAREAEAERPGEGRAGATTPPLPPSRLRLWPELPMATTLLSSMLAVFVGTPSAGLSSEETDRLVWALDGFRKRPVPGKVAHGPSGLFKSSVPDHPYGDEVQHPPPPAPLHQPLPPSRP